MLKKEPETRLAAPKFAMSWPDDGVRQMMSRNGFDFTKNIGAADIVVFPGGADVTPFLYGDIKHPETQSDYLRDREEVRIYKQIPYWTPKVGICRGAQFLNVMAGGPGALMFQDVNNHAVRDGHEIREVGGTDKLRVSSTHHQMMIPGDNAQLLYMGREATRKETGENKFEEDANRTDWNDAEILYYSDVTTLCFQPHPEYKGWDDTRILFFNLLDTYLLSANHSKAAREMRILRCGKDGIQC